MVSAKLQKRLAASVLSCGKGRVWLDPSEIGEITAANSRESFRRLARDGLILRRPSRTRSKYRARRLAEAKGKGRRSGYGKRKGTREARLPSKLLWIRKVRVLRRLLKKHREAGKINKHVYHHLYLKNINAHSSCIHQRTSSRSLYLLTLPLQTILITFGFSFSGGLNAAAGDSSDGCLPPARDLPLSSLRHQLQLSSSSSPRSPHMQHTIVAAGSALSPPPSPFMER